MASSRREYKRHGKHQKHTKDFLKVYIPYLPMLLIIVVGLVLSVISPPKNYRNVLSYATSMSTSDLLSVTNQERQANGLAPLVLNYRLNSAAQAKANDMVSRNYWAHVTPDGQQPWAFISNAGYAFSAAAENLAYGFSTSNATVKGWMNSPEHRTNMLNGNYTEVGFGFKDSSNFVGSGQETVVVAEYAKPSSNIVSVKSSSTSTPNSNKTYTQTISTPTNNVAPQASSSPAVDKTLLANSTKKQSTLASFEPETYAVNRLSNVTGSQTDWLFGFASITIALGVAALAIRHAYALNKFFKAGERYLVHHFVFDLTVISLIVVCLVAQQAVGYIK